MLYSPEASARQFPGGAFSLEGSPGEGRGGAGTELLEYSRMKGFL